jgi:alpha-amylase
MLKKFSLILLSVLFASQLAFSTDYGLASTCQDGVILHCFDWSCNQIKYELPSIAAAGFSSVQVSPVQSTGSGLAWTELYSPYGFTIGNNIGTTTTLTDLCTEAHKYGIKVIVDVVANHLAGGTEGAAGYYTAVENDLHNDAYWHTEDGSIDYSNRWSITRRKMGMPDLNTENSFVQGKVKDYVAALKSCGVDGIRWDAAKHIGLPNDWDNASSTFWTNVLDQTMYNYGEVLDSPCSVDDGTLAKRYCSLMSVTDNGYSNWIAGSINAGKADFTYGGMTLKGCPDNKILLWTESHDKYIDGTTSGYSVANINKAWAIVGSRAGYTALYFSRPKTKPYIGMEGTSDWKDAEVAAVNHFHNSNIGQKEYFNIDNGTVCILRGKGCVLVKASGSGAVSVANSASTVPAGTYKDAITGNSFTITSSTISGTIGSTGIAVMYNDTITGGGGGGGNTGSGVDSTKLVLNSGEQAVFFENTASWGSGINAYAWSNTTPVVQYSGAWPGSAATSIGGNVYKWTYTGTATIAGGLIFNDGTNQTADLTWVNGGYYNANGYVKTIGGGTAPVDTTTTKTTDWTIFFSKPSSWGTSVNAYVYSSESGSLTELAKWPGKAMTLGSDGYYKISFPLAIKTGYVLFNDGTNQVPAYGNLGFELINYGVYNENGYDHSGVSSVSVGSSMKVFAHAGALYVNAPAPCNVTVSSVDGKTMSFSLEQGMNVIATLPHGFYIVAGHKVVL